MEAHITKPLNNNALTVERAGKFCNRHVARITEEFAQGILNATACRLRPALNAALIDRFAGDAGATVYIGGVHAHVLIGHPCHLALACAHVRCGDVLRGVDQVALGEFVGEPAGDRFELVLLPCAGVDAQTALGPAEWRLYQCAFVRHQSGKRLNLVLIDGGSVTNTALDRLHMFGMNRTVSGECVNCAAKAHAETHRIGCVANAYLFLQPRREIHQPHRAVEHDIYGFTK